MERINLCKNRQVIIPATINGKDIDLPFNADDMRVRAVVVSMASDIAEYTLRGDSISALAGSGKTPREITDALAKAKAFVNDGLDLCASISQRMSDIIPEWHEAVGDAFVNLETFEALVACMQSLIMDREVHEKVNDQLETER